MVNPTPSNEIGVSQSNASPTCDVPLGEDEDEPPSNGHFIEQSTQSVCETNAAQQAISKSSRDEQPNEPNGSKGYSFEAAVERAKPVKVTVARLTTRQRLQILFVPTHELGPSPTYGRSLVNAIMYSPVNVLLVFIPVSWALHWTHQSDTAIFTVSALAIVPLAALLGLGTEQVALRTSSAVGGLLNASLGNVVELIIAGIALNKCDLALVQSTLLGGLLSNLLLVLGTAFLVSGYRFHSQEFQPMAAQLNSSLMTVSVIALLIPASFHEYLGERVTADNEGGILLKMSRGSAIVLIVIYFAYLSFQFYSHAHFFVDVEQITDTDSSDSTSSKSSIGSPSASSPSRPRRPLSMGLGLHHRISQLSVDRQNLTAVDVDIERTASSASSSTPSSDHVVHPRLNTPFAWLILVASTVLAFVTAENLVDSVNGLTEGSSVSKEWVTLIVIPIISNAAEHTTAVVVASKGKFDLAMSVAVGSCIQIALFVIPVLVLVAWGLGKPLTLLFDLLEIICLFLSVLLVKFAIEDGRAHWMSGTALVAVYILIAVCFWFYPGIRSSELTGLICT